MLEYSDGNIFDSNCELLVNPVNCVGVMGGGLALQFAQLFPEMENEYKMVCRNKALKPGLIHLWKGTDVYIANFPTKNDFRLPSKLEYIATGLDRLANTTRSYKFKSIAFPALGCGLGGLDFPRVETEIKKFATIFPEIKIILFAPKELQTVKENADAETESD